VTSSVVRVTSSVARVELLLLLVVIIVVLRPHKEFWG
jgi:hypothetical protein